MNKTKTLTLNPIILIVRYFSFKFNLKFFWALGVFLTILLLVFYIIQTNSLAFEGFLAQSYQKKIDKLAKENEKLEINSAAAGSLSNINVLLSDLNFEKIGKIQYIQILESSMVVK